MLPVNSRYSGTAIEGTTIYDNLWKIDQVQTNVVKTNNASGYA